MGLYKKGKLFGVFNILDIKGGYCFWICRKMDREGQQYGQVERLIVDDKMALTKILVRRDDGLVWTEIDNVVFGDHLVWLASGSCFKSAQNGEESAYIHLLDTEVLDVSGRINGIAHDFVFDPVRKCITGLEVSDGLVADWLNGRQVAAVRGLQFDGGRWISVDIGKEGAEN